MTRLGSITMEYWWRIMEDRGSALSKKSIKIDLLKRNTKNLLHSSISLPSMSRGNS